MNDRAPHKWVIAGTVLTGTIMAVLDSTIVNVALPSMSGTLGATITEITWVVTGYLLSNVIIMPMIALLSARFGRKRFYMTSVVVFTASSMLCGLANSLPLMVVFRVLQGAGAGALITVAQAVLRETFPPEEQGMAMGIYGLGVVVAPAIGPTLGGWITDQYSWPWVFYINVPIGIVNLLLVNRFIHDPHYLVREKGKIDFLGLGFMAVGLGALQLMLEKGEEKDWFQSSLIVGLAATAGLGLLLFIWRELSSDRPAVNLRLLRNIPFSSATAVGGVLGMGLYGGLFLLPMFLQRLLGYPALTSGLALMPRALAMAVITPVGGWLYNRVGPRVLVGTGLAVAAFSFWDLSHLTTDVGFWDIFYPQMWQGVGFGLIFVSLATAALSAIPRPQMTAASGLFNVVRQVFGSVGIAATATMLTSGTERYHSILSEHATPFAPAATNWLRSVTAGLEARGADPLTAERRALEILDLRVMRQAAVLAYNHVFLMVALLFVLALPLVLMLRAGHRTQTGRAGPRGAGGAAAE